MRLHKDEQHPKPVRLPGCTCGKPIGIVIPPGQHIHPCPIHTEKIMHSSYIVLIKESNVTDR